MEQHTVERRQGRRVELEAPLMIRRSAQDDPQGFTKVASKNVSMRGVYFEMGDGDSYAPHDVLTVSVSIPPSRTHLFPFIRIAGYGRVVRIDPASPPGSQAAPSRGVALEFDRDVTVLTAIPGRI